MSDTKLTSTLAAAERLEQELREKHRDLFEWHDRWKDSRPRPDICRAAALRVPAPPSKE